MHKITVLLIVFFFSNALAQIKCSGGGIPFEEEHRDVPHLCSVDFPSCPKGYKCEKIRGVSDPLCCPPGEVRNIGCPGGAKPKADCQTTEECPEIHSCEIVSIVGSDPKRKCCPMKRRYVGCPDGAMPFREKVKRGKKSEPQDCADDAACPALYSCHVVGFIGRNPQRQCCPDPMPPPVCPDGSDPLDDGAACSDDDPCPPKYQCKDIGRLEKICCLAPVPTPKPLNCGYTKYQPIIERVGDLSGIDGGVASNPYSWPWMLSSNALKEPGHLTACGASLIHKQWAITAAHCLPELTVYEPSKGYIRAGVFDKNNRSDGIRVEMANVFVHPEHFYQENPFIMQHDIALIKLESPLNSYDGRIGVVCLSRDDSNAIRTNQQLIATGWGRHGFNQGAADDLHEVSLPVMSYDRYCKRKFNDRKNSFCVREDGRNRCLGDHGGPSIYRETNGLWYQYGIGSYVSINCYGTATFTRVSAYCDWIRDIVGENICQ